MLEKDNIILEARIDNLCSSVSTTAIVNFVEKMLFSKFLQEWYDARARSSFFFAAPVSNELIDAITRSSIEFEGNKLDLSLYSRLLLVCPKQDHFPDTLDLEHLLAVALQSKLIEMDAANNVIENNVEIEFKLHRCHEYSAGNPTFYCPPKYLPYVKMIGELVINSYLVRIDIIDTNVNEVPYLFCTTPSYSI